MSFRSDLEAAHKKKVVGLLDKVTRKVALDIQRDLTLETPVDEGTARSNWQGSIAVPKRGSTNATSGSTPINFAGYIVGKTIYIANNLPYIKRLNEGSSKQAPVGFVNNIIQRNVNRIKSIAKAFIQ